MTNLHATMFQSHPSTRNRTLARPNSRFAASALETLVAFTLLSCVLSVSLPLVVRHKRLLTAQQNERLALDELSNQLDRLCTMPLANLPEALHDLAPSPFLSARLSGATLSGEMNEESLGTRITLHLRFPDTKRAAVPLTMSTWVFPDPTKPSADTAEGGTP